MIHTRLDLNLKGRKFFDRLTGEKLYVTDFPASIEFPAPYAIYAFNSHGRSIRESSLIRRGNDIRQDFIDRYRRNKDFDVELAVQYATRRHLEEMRRYELNAPGPPPPHKNIYADRLRRVTGRLSDTATISRQFGAKGRSALRRGQRRAIDTAESARISRRVGRATTLGVKGVRQPQHGRIR